MPLPNIFSLILFTAFAIYFFFGMNIISQNIHSRMHRILSYGYFALCIWAFSFSIANSAQDFETCLLWRRLSAFGWGSLYSLLLHFILILTEKHNLLKNKCLYIALYLPVLINIFVFGPFTEIAKTQYNLVETSAGWTNVSESTLWGSLFQVYYLLFNLISMGLLWQWSRSSPQKFIKKQSQIILIAYAIALVIGSMTEYAINYFFPFKTPQMAPVVVLLPMSILYYYIKRSGFIKPVEKNEQVDTGQILTEINRSHVYGYITYAIITGAFFCFASIYFIYGADLYSILTFCAIIFFIGLSLHIFQNLKINTRVKETISNIVIIAIIPFSTLGFLKSAGITVWSISFILILLSILLSNKQMLIAVGVTTLATIIILWIAKPTVHTSVSLADHVSRIAIFGSFFGVAFYINRIFLQRLAEKEQQVEFQKLLTQISARLVIANENNIGVILNEVLSLLGKYFNIDRAYFIFFPNNLESKNNTIYEWHNARTSPFLNAMINEVNEKNLPQWVDLNRFTQDGNIYIPNAAGLPESRVEKNWVQESKIKSLFLLPLSNKGKVMGALGFESIHETKKWTPDNREIVKIIANNISDIWLKVKAESEIAFMAYHDALTGLPNRSLIEDRMKQAINLAARTVKYVAVMFIDIDNFKTINDILGHNGGDALLIEVAKRISGCLRQYDTVSRFGGDEFLVMTPEISRLEDIQKIARKIMRSFQEPLKLNNQEFVVATSMGIAVFPIDGESSSELIKNADLAMYTSKEQGKNRFTFCSSEMKKGFLKNTELTNDLYRALERDELLLYYQPQVVTATEKICGVEALIRWQHPQRGMIPPGDFIPIAEKNGLITPIGQWALQTACRQNKAWQDQGLPPIRMAVNLSLGQFLSKNLVATVANILQESGLNPANLELEITESIAINEPEYIIKTLNELKALGVSISIDDFGTEYSSLSRLRNLPIDRIKIDMQFVHGITRGDKEEGIIKVILELGRTLGLQTIAEGVETEQQLAFLKKVLCDEIQGYYFYKPMPLDKVEQILKKHNFT